MTTTDTKWYMAGTEGTGEYKVIARGAFGRVGVRLLSGAVRVRVEPKGVESAKKMTRKLKGWKQPYGEPGGNLFRFSTVIGYGAEAIKVVETALGVVRRVRLTWNLPDWENLVSKKADESENASQIEDPIDDPIDDLVDDGADIWPPGE